MAKIYISGSWRNQYLGRLGEAGKYRQFMEVSNLLDIHTREDLYAWYLANHDKVSDFWLRVNRSNDECHGVIRYVDAVEVALCYGWIDSTQKRIDEGKPVQHFTPRRKGSNWCEQNIERCRRLIKIGEMTPAGLAVLPDLDPKHFVFEDWAINAIKADRQAWGNFLSFPENYRRIKLDRIQHYRNTDRHEQADTALKNFIRDCHNGKMSPNWSVRWLQRQVGSNLYERIALSKDKNEVLKLATEGQTIEKPSDIIKNPFTMEFSG